MTNVTQGARLRRLTSGPGRHYAPYFYNPHLDPSGRFLLYSGTLPAADGDRPDWGTEQVFLLEVESGRATQLTTAQGRDQHWSPYIKQGVAGIRPQFVCWSQPDWQHAVYWEQNRLCRVHVQTRQAEVLFELDPRRVPQVPHCSAAGWVAWGYLPAALQERFRGPVPLRQLLAEDRQVQDTLRSGQCGFMVYDLAQRRLVLDQPTPFWPNHVQASPDNRYVLFCQEGPWDAQRMHLLEAGTRTWAPLRPQQAGQSIGHEFSLSPTVVGYHGSTLEGSSGAKRGFFGRIDVTTGRLVETPSAAGEQHYGHYHAWSSPEGGTWIVTDGEVTADSISLARFATEPGSALRFTPIARHNWNRKGDQRVHPHPHWHAAGRQITFTGCDPQPDPSGQITTQVLLLDLGDAGALERRSSSHNT